MPLLDVSASPSFPEMLQNPDLRSLPPGCVTHLDSERRQWYYVHLQNNPPRVTFIHPADETPSSSYNSYFPAQSSTPQQQPSFRQPMYNQLENSPPQQPMSIIQNPTIQPQSSYGNRSSFGQGNASVQDYTSRQQLNPSPPNNPSSFAMNHARHHSAQSMYGTAIPQMPQTPSDNSRFSMYSTNSHGTTQEMEFDASILYSSPVSASPTSAVPFSSPSPISPVFQPQRRRMTLDDSESFMTPTSNHPQSQSVPVSNPATRRFQPQNVLRRRKMKAAAALAAIPPQPPATLQKPNEVPVYSLVAQAPLVATMKPTTPSFQTQLYSKPPVPSSLPDLSSNSNQNSGPLQITPPRTLSLPPITTSNQQGLFMSQYPSSASTGSMTIPQQPLSPLRAQNTGGSHVIPSVSYMNSHVPSLMQANSHSTLGLSNGIMGAPLNPTPLTMNHTPSLMSMSSNAQLDGSSNGTTGLPMTSIPPLTYNQPQSLISQLDGFSNGTMTLPGAPLVSPTMIPTQPQQPNSFSNGLLGNNAMAQPSLSMPPPQQPNMLSNGYALGLPSSASVAQMQGGMIGQSPGVMGQPTTAQQKAVPKDNKNNQLMKKVGMSFGKAVLKFGTKYAMEQIGVDGAVADASEEC